MTKNTTTFTYTLSEPRADEYLRILRQYFNRPRAGLKRLLGMAIREFVAYAEQANGTTLADVNRDAKEAMKEAQS